MLYIVCKTIFIYITYVNFSETLRHSFNLLFNERYQVNKNFHTKKCLTEMPRSHDERHMKSKPRKLN